MILNSGPTFVLQWRRPVSLRAVDLSSPSTTAEQLRQQLDSLHKEADSTRAKASNARLRLMRLSEAAEKLRRQAAVSVHTGKENDARDLLFQKKNVMQAMEKLKNRIELFDKLSAKLNSAISMKEGLLIGNMALDLDVSETESSSPIRIVSPNEENSNIIEDQHIDQNYLKSRKDHELQILVHGQKVIHAENERNDAEQFQYLRGNSPYEDFMKKLDQDLNKIENELESFLRFSNLLLESKEKPEYSKVQDVMDILDGVRQTRERISITQTTSSDHVPF